MPMIWRFGLLPVSTFHVLSVHILPVFIYVFIQVRNGTFEFIDHSYNYSLEFLAEISSTSL
jgi:hypothetical protein